AGNHRRRRCRGGCHYRAERDRRVRAEPCGGRIDRAQPRPLRGRAADRRPGRIGGGADPGRPPVRMSDLDRVCEVARAALASLEASRRHIDDLNVYPVPDGDTGTNLTLTGRAIVEELERSSAADRGSIARGVTRAALMGARGNSGVIFSQIVRGAAEVLGAAPVADAPAVATALRGAADAAYRAVRRPVEGTMLTVVREMAEEAQSQSPHAASLRDLLPLVLRRGEEALDRTPELLDVLREAGVVDAGGAGLVEIVRGIAATLR